MSDAEEARGAAMLALREKTVYGGIESNSAAVTWFWQEIARRSPSDRAALHRALFGDIAHSPNSAKSNGNNSNSREIRIMSAGEDQLRLITCNALVHVLLLPIYSSQELFQRRFDESLAGSFKKQRTTSREPISPAPAPQQSSGSAILRRHSTQSSSAHTSSTVLASAFVAAVALQQTQSHSVVRQGLHKFESQSAIAVPASRPLSLQQRLELDQTLRNPTPPALTAAASSQPLSPPAPVSRVSPRQSASIVASRISPRSFVPSSASRSQPPAATPPAVPLAPKAPARPSTASAPPLPLTKSPTKQPTEPATVVVKPTSKPTSAPATVVAPSVAPVVASAPIVAVAGKAVASTAAAAATAAATPAVKPQPPPGAPTSSQSARPPLPSSRPPPPRQSRDDPSVTSSNGKSFSEVLAKPPKPASISPRTPSERSSKDDRDEITLQRAAQAEAQRVENERQVERTKKLARLDERQKPIFELVVTEEDYCRWLITHMCFVDSLRRHRVLSDDEIQEVFPQVAALKESSASLVRAFAAAGEGVFERVGEIFVNSFDASAQSAMYESVAAQEVAAAKLQQLLATNEEFARYCRKARYEVETALTDVQSMQIKPFQRLTKYPLLFRAILAATPVSAPDYAALGEAAAVVARVLKQVDDLRETRERREKAIQLEQRIAGASSARSEPAHVGSVAVANADELRNVRVLLHEGEVTLLDDAGTEREVHMFLFSDMVMFARTTSKFQRKVMGDKSFRMHDELPLTASCIVAESRRPGLVHAFDICCVVDNVGGDGVSKRRGPRKATLICSTHVEVAAWLYALETAIAAIKAADAADAAAASIALPHHGGGVKSKRASAGIPSAMARSTDDDEFDSAAAGAKKRIKKRRASAGGAAESAGRLERQLLAAQKTRDGLVKLVQFYSDDPASASEASAELAECDQNIATLRQRLASARK